MSREAYDKLRAIAFVSSETTQSLASIALGYVEAGIEQFFEESPNAIQALHVLEATRESVDPK
jgi:hypothetical protein